MVLDERCQLAALWLLWTQLTTGNEDVKLGKRMVRGNMVGEGGGDNTQKKGERRRDARRKQ